MRLAAAVRLLIPALPAVAMAAFGCLAAAPAMAPVPRNVLIGGVGPGFKTLADPAANARMLAAGTIGLYEHANAIAPLSPAQREAIYRTWGLPTAGQRQTVGEVGGYAPMDPSYLAYFGGVYPVEVNMTTITNSGDGSGSYTAAAGEAHPGQAYEGFATPADLARMKAAIQAANGAGARNVAIFMTPNGGKEDLDDPFATGGFWANLRAAARFGGGIALDVPPNYYLARGGAYQAMIVQMIRWANGNGLRSSLTVSPYALRPDSAGNVGGCGFDPAFAEATQTLVANVTAAGALPTQWVVENYGLAGPACGTANDVASDAAPESLNAVALYLARAGAVHPPGTTPAGANGVREAGLLSRPVPVPAGR